MTVGDRTFPLAGIEGVPGPMADEMQRYIDANGNTVNCDPAGLVRYVCVLPDGTDLARVALVNGAARLAANAPDEYSLQRDIARKEKRGIWAQAVARQTRTVYEVDTADYETTLMARSWPADVTYVDNEPLAYVDGESVAVLYDQDYGWGYWDSGHHWHHAPSALARGLEEKHPHGAGIQRHPESFVHQQTETLRSAARAGSAGGQGGGHPGGGQGMAGGGHPGAGGGQGMAGGAQRGGNSGGAAAASRAQAFASPRAAAASGGSRSSSSNGASSFVQQHMSNHAMAQRAGGGFGAFGGGHAGGGGTMRAGGGGGARAAGHAGGGRSCGRRC
jgi:hypothetical protein